MVSPESGRDSCAWPLSRMDVKRRFKLVKLQDLFQSIYECFSLGLVCSQLSQAFHPKCISC